jgi:pyruvate dehydrogenase E2 component (dihydrolipoamide acetyltransferase)
MATILSMPKWGLAMKTGLVVAWIKHPGDSVRQGEPIVQIESEKISNEVEAPATGILRWLEVAEGQEAPIGAALAVIVAPGEELSDEQVAALIHEDAETKRQKTEMLTRQQAPAARTPAAVREPVVGTGGRVNASPVARRLAQERGIDLATVVGTGPGGRITIEDVQQALDAAATSMEEPSAAQVIPLTGMRGTIARRMHQSLQNTAQVTLISEVDVTDLKQMRETLKQDFDLTYTDMIVRAAALALKEHPRLNAHADGESIRLSRDIHIGVAVALEDGLIVPVVKNADRKALREIARDTRRLGQQAREGALTHEEVTGSTFSVTNLGMYGVDAFTPIINPPEVAILGVGRIVEKPARGQQGVEWRQMLTLSLTFDHRCVDGAPAAAFLQAVRKQLEEPAALAG